MPTYRDRLGSTGTVENAEFVPYSSQKEADKAVPQDLPNRGRLIDADDEVDNTTQFQGAQEETSTADDGSKSTSGSSRSKKIDPTN